jgi:hypothetical protein
MVAKLRVLNRRARARLVKQLTLFTLRRCIPQCLSPLIPKQLHWLIPRCLCLSIALDLQYIPPLGHLLRSITRLW